MNHKLEIATGVYLFAAAIQYGSLYQNPTFGDLLRHNPPETTAKSILPWFIQRIPGQWMLPRRDLTFAEYPAGHAIVALSPLFGKYFAKRASNMIVNGAKKIAYPLKEGNLNEIGKEIERFVHECAGR